MNLPPPRASAIPPCTPLALVAVPTNCLPILQSLAAKRAPGYENRIVAVVVPRQKAARLYRERKIDRHLPGVSPTMPKLSSPHRRSVPNAEWIPEGEVKKRRKTPPLRRIAPATPSPTQDGFPFFAQNSPPNSNDAPEASSSRSTEQCLMDDISCWTSTFLARQRERSLEAKKIPKPEGEAGRPGRGGYNLRVALNWRLEQYTAIKNYVHNLARTYLDTSIALTLQDTTRVDSLCLKAAERFPILNDYMDSWATKDILRCHLKYTSSRGRLKGTKKGTDIGSLSPTLPPPVVSVSYPSHNPPLESTCHPPESAGQARFPMQVADNS